MLLGEKTIEASCRGKEETMLRRLELENFTAFRSLEVEFSPGINVFIGENGTGKTHLLKLLYVACDITRSKKPFGEKLVDVFLPSQGQVGRLAHRQKGSVSTKIAISRDPLQLQLPGGQKLLRAHFSNHTQRGKNVRVEGLEEWSALPLQSVYLPVKEMLAHAPGFRSLYAERQIAFEETYFDLIDRAYLPKLRGPTDTRRRRLLRSIEKTMKGKVITKGEVFFLRNVQGELEFSLLAEGMRKLALLWLLVQNGTLTNGSILFWDEPEANLHPSATSAVIKDVLFGLYREVGVQVFLATHDYVVLKELDLSAKKTDSIRFHALYRDEKTNEVRIASADNYQQFEPNTIANMFLDFYDRDIERALKPSDDRNYPPRG